MNNRFSWTTGRALLQLAAFGLAFFGMAMPGRADTAFPSSISVYWYPVIASPSKIPVTVDGCGVFRLGRRLHVGFSFRNLELDSMTAVKISVDLYDPFHNLLTTLDSTINGNYSPGAEIVVPELEQPGNTMPVFEAHDVWPSAASAVCYVSSVLYANGDVWNASSRPSLDVASHALENMTKNASVNAHKAVAKELSDQKALGYQAAMIAPQPVVVPDGWKTVHGGMYVDIRHPSGGLHLLAYTALTGPGGKGAFKPSDIPAARYMEGVRVAKHARDGRVRRSAAEFMEVHGTTTSGPQVVEAIKVRTNGVSYISSYTRSFDAAPSTAGRSGVRQHLLLSGCAER